MAFHCDKKQGAGLVGKRFPFRVLSLYGQTIFVWDSQTVPVGTVDLCGVSKQMSDG